MLFQRLHSAFGERKNGIIWLARGREGNYLEQHRNSQGIARFSQQPTATPPCSGRKAALQQGGSASCWIPRVAFQAISWTFLIGIMVVVGLLGGRAVRSHTSFHRKRYIFPRALSVLFVKKLVFLGEKSSIFMSKTSFLFIKTSLWGIKK